MKWKHNFKHIDVSDSLKQYVEGTFEKVGHFLRKDSQGQVFYSKGKHHHECRVEVHVQIAGRHFKASGESDSFYSAVDESADKLGKQFQKKKEKQRQHKHPSRSKEGRLERVNSRLEYDDSSNPGKKSA